MIKQLTNRYFIKIYCFLLIIEILNLIQSPNLFSKTNFKNTNDLTNKNLSFFGSFCFGTYTSKIKKIEEDINEQDSRYRYFDLNKKASTTHSVSEFLFGVEYGLNNFLGARFNTGYYVVTQNYNNAVASLIELWHSEVGCIFHPLKFDLWDNFSDIYIGSYLGFAVGKLYASPVLRNYESIPENDFTSGVLGYSISPAIGYNYIWKGGLIIGIEYKVTYMALRMSNANIYNDIYKEFHSINSFFILNVGYAFNL